jgi:hypothetical protein
MSLNLRRSNLIQKTNVSAAGGKKKKTGRLPAFIKVFFTKSI